MKLVLLDRDGVLNEDRLDYVKSPAELVIFPQALKALALFKRRGFTCVIITNQSAIGRGIITEAALERIHGHLRDEIKRHGGHIEDIFHCPDAPSQATYRRKPSPGMLLEALAKYKADAASTPFIGDTVGDMKAGFAAGCPRYLVMTGKGKDEMRALPENIRPVEIALDVLDAAHKIAGSFT